MTDQLPSSKDDDENSSEIPEKRMKLMQTLNLRKFRKIPIYIVEYHNEVLEFIYKCFASRHLPLKNNTLIHFDSHPDMVISRDIQASIVYDKNELLSKLSIENWIMPACYAGHFNNLIWIKNKWCDQLPCGKHDFKIGDRDNMIQVNLPVSYFISEGNYCEENLLSNSKPITLQVINSGENENIIDAAIQFDETNLILDIDLDFFSTLNPFLKVYEKADCYNKLKEIFSYDEAGEIYEVCENRTKQLDKLTEVFNYLDENRNLDNFDKNKIEDEKLFEKIVILVNTIKDKYEDDEIDWEIIRDAGFTSDHDGLPNHHSTEDELKVYFRNFEEFLKKLPHPPVIVTISRSSEDDYCPEDQVEVIQDEVLQILQKVFKDKISQIPILAYDDDEKDNWDIMKM